MRKFILLPTWILFILLGVIPFGLSILESKLFPMDTENPYNALFQIPYILIYTAWLCGLSSELTKQLLKKGEKVSGRLAPTLVIISFLTMLICSLFEGLLANPIVLVVFVLGTIFSFFYMMYKITYMMRLLEGKSVTMGVELRRDFFLFACVSIGIWFLQPRIRKVLEPSIS